MNNKRRFLRFDVSDFLEIRPVKETPNASVKGKTTNFSLMGICFSSEMNWKIGQVLEIDYFIPTNLDSVKIKLLVVWNEFIDERIGYLTGGQIIDVDRKKQDKFTTYYFRKLKEKFFK
jgi:hypothetical protein